MDSSVRILVIDDNPDDRLLAIRVLRREFPALEAREIADGAGFEAALESGNFDAVVTDYRLGWASGLDLLRALKSRYPDRPVIMFTSTGDQETAVEAMKSGLDDYVVKSPRHFARLPVAVRAALERADARRRAARAEEVLRLVTEQAPAHIWITDRDLRVTSVSGSALEQLGVDPDRYIGKTLYELAPDAQSAIDAHLRALASETAGYERESHGRVFECRVRPLRDSEGRVAGCLGLALDVTVHRRSEEAVRDSEERFRLMVENAKDFAIFMLHPDGRVATWNAGARTLLGYEEEEIVGRHSSLLRTPEDREAGAHERELERARQDGRAGDNNWLVRKDGSRFWAEGLTVGLRDGEFRGYAKIVRDVTERRRMEGALEARARQQEAVAALGRRAIAERDLGVLMGEAVSLVACVLRVEYCKVLELLPGGEELRLAAGVGWREGLVGEATVGTGLDSQAGYTLASDGPVIVRDLATETRFSGPPLLHEHRVVSGLSAVIGGQDGPFGVLGAHTRECREFTPEDANFLQAVANVLATAIRRRGYEERLAAERAEAERLGELDRLRSEFVSSISHDLKTPLTAAGAALGMLEMSASERLRADERRLLGNARRNADRLRRLIDDLLAYNQLEAGTLRVQAVPLDLRAVVADAVGTVQPLVEEKGQELVVDLPEPLPVEADPFRLGQVLINLLGNAHEHTPAGTRISLSGEAGSGEVRSGEVVLSVSDNGPGIPEGELETVFERARRLDPTPGGFGLGLAITKGIIELHGGRVWVESEPGRGARFCVALRHANQGGQG